MIWILVGTETGNSLDFAERASDDLQCFGIRSEVVLIDDLPLETFLQECQTVLFICSTTGDGEAPLCMRNFMKFLLRANLPGDLLSGMHFGVFGLGDSSYEKFNFVGKRLWRRVPQLGAEPLVPFRGEGDEQHPNGGIEHGWQQWWTEVKAKLCTSKVEIVTTVKPKHRLVYGNGKVVLSKGSFFPASLVSNCRLTPNSHFQETRLLKFSISSDDHELSFLPGDILALLPHNDSEQVEDLFGLLSLDSSVIINGIESTSLVPWTNECISYPITLLDFFVRFVDISAIPSRTCCRRLAQFVDVNAAPYSEMHKEKLLELSTDESEYLDYIWRPKRSILEVLKDFAPSVKVSFDNLLHVFKPMRRRQFSIASLPRNSSGRWELELCVALIEHNLSGNRGKREGVISRCFRTGQLLNDTAQILKGSWSMACLFKVKKVLLFATGTGIAPIRHLIQFIKANGLDIEITLFYGCRSLKADFYFEQEWRDLGITVFAAGSRDSEGKKIYLDSVIEDASDFLKEIEVSLCACFVAGHTRLNKLISTALSSIWGSECVNQLKLDGRYQTETWS